MGTVLAPGAPGRRRRAGAAHPPHADGGKLARRPGGPAARRPGGPAPLPTAAGIRGAVVHLVDWVTGNSAPAPRVPVQQAGKAPARQRQVPAAVTRAVARAGGHAAGRGAGQLPAYTFPAAKVKAHVTGLADLGGASSFNPATSTLVPSGATAASKLYRNADGSYTRLEYPGAGSGQAAALAFSGPSGVGVKGTHVTSASLEVLEAWTAGCPATAMVTVTDASGRQAGRWTGKPPASACGSASNGGWISVPVSGAELQALSSQPGAQLAVAVTPAAASPAAASQPPSAAPAASASAAAPASASPPATATAAPPATTAATAGPTGSAAATAAAPAPAGGSPASTSPAGAGRTSPAAGSSVAASVSAGSDAVLVVTAAAAQTPQVSSQWPTSGYNSPTLTPELIGSGSDTYGSPLTYQFTVHDSTGTWLAASKWIPANDWVVPSGTLAWDKTYYWTVQAFDSGGTGSPDPQMFALQTPVPQPLLYEGLAQDGSGPGGSQDGSGPVLDPQNGNFTTQATDASVHVTGPPLSIQRTYNSLEPLDSGAFGAGWSSVLDMNISDDLLAPGGSTTTEVVTYPDGEKITFGKNADGSYTSPQGRYATLVPAPSGTGFQLVDKNDEIYTLSQPVGSTTYAITSIADAQGHVSVGGLQYRAALEGNAVVEDPGISNVQIMSRGSTGPVDLTGGAGAAGE
jgi:Domain of unknown function (DUF6531)